MKYEKQDLLDLFRMLEKKHGRRPSKRIWINDEDTPTLSPIDRLFGNWTGFLKEMDLVPLKPSEISKGRKNRKAVFGSGYIAVYNCNHFSADKTGFVLEHRMIMSEFLGRKLSYDEHVHHKNGDKSDNRIENLVILTASDHMKYHRKYTPELFACLKGENNHYSKLKEKDVIAIRKLYATKKYSMAEISKMFLVTPGTIYACISKRTWKNINEKVGR